MMGAVIGGGVVFDGEFDAVTVTDFGNLAHKADGPLAVLGKLDEIAQIVLFGHGWLHRLWSLYVD